jgi:DNA polymerase I-like protein with 3'-5' exonuclease and polymerase domains
MNLADAPLSPPQPPILPPSTPYEYVQDDDSLRQALAQRLDAEIIGLDCETTGLDPLHDTVCLLQLATPDHPVLIINFRTLTGTGRQLLCEFLAKPVRKVFHHAKFDLGMLQAESVTVAGPYADTMLAAQLLHIEDLKKKGRFSLATLVHDYLRHELSKEQQTSDWSRELTPDQLAYAAKDAAILLPLWEALVQALQAAELMPAAELEFAAIPAVVEMERVGMPVNRDALTTLHRELHEACEEAASETRTTLGVPTLNLHSPKQLMDAFRHCRILVSSTGKDSLRPNAGLFPQLQPLLRYKELQSRVQCLETLQAHVDPRTRRLHADYRQIGAATGRFSCSQPNLQNISRDPRIRQCFVAEPGYLLVVADMSQVELRITAEISGDQRMITAYQEGQDLHQLTASLLTGKPLDSVTPDDRQAAKAVNFGLIYAMGAQGLRAYARANYDVELSAGAAEAFIKRFFAAYRGVAAWQTMVDQQGGYESRTLSGRRRQWATQPPLTELLNTPVQGTGADILKRTLGLLHPALQGTGTRIIATVHDEIVLEALKTRAEEVAAQLEHIIKQAGAAYLTRIPLEVEVRIAKNWAKK